MSETKRGGSIILLVVSIILIIFIVATVALSIFKKYYYSNHYIVANSLDVIAADLDESDTTYFFIRKNEEIEKFNNIFGTDIYLSEDFDFDKYIILVCVGHELKKAYYVLADEDNIFAKQHFLYVCVDKTFNEKVYLYIVPKGYTSWMFSKKYIEGKTTGMIFE